MANSTLPKKGDWSLLNDWGVQIVGEQDEFFYDVVLPAGWTKEETGHPLHTNLKDENHLIRAKIFYKAIIYDRRASIDPIKERWIAKEIYKDNQGNCLKSNERAFIVISIKIGITVLGRKHCARTIYVYFL